MKLETSEGLKEALNENVLNIERFIEKLSNEPKNELVIEMLREEFKAKKEVLKETKTRKGNRKEKEELLFGLLIDFISLSKKAELIGNSRLKSKINREIYGRKIRKLKHFHQFRKQCEEFLRNEIQEIFQRKFREFDEQICPEYTEEQKAKILKEILNKEGLILLISSEESIKLIKLQGRFIWTMFKNPRLKITEENITQAEKKAMGLI